MGGGGTSSSTSYAQSPEVTSFVNQTLPQLQQAQGRAPLYQFMDPQVRQVAGFNPMQSWTNQTIQGMTGMPQQTAQAANLYGGLPGQAGQQVGVTGLEQQGLGTLNQMVGVAGQDVGMQGPEYAALQQLAQLTGGPLGSSPATQAGMSAFEQLVKPGMQNDLNVMGMGRSGAGAEQINLARTAAATPLLQQEIQNRANAVPQYLNLGGTLGQRATEGIGRETQALGSYGGAQMGLGGAEAGRMESAIQRLLQGTQVAAGGLTGIGQQQLNAAQSAATLGGAQGALEQQTAQSALDAPLQDFIRRQGLAQNVTTGLAGVPYSTQSSQTTTTPKTGFFGK